MPLLIGQVAPFFAGCDLLGRPTRLLLRINWMRVLPLSTAPGVRRRSKAGTAVLLLMEKGAKENEWIINRERVYAATIGANRQAKRSTPRFLSLSSVRRCGSAKHRQVGGPYARGPSACVLCWANLQGQVDIAALYHDDGETWNDPIRAQIYRRLAAVEEATPKSGRRESRRPSACPAAAPGFWRARARLAGAPLRAALRLPTAERRAARQRHVRRAARGGRGLPGAERSHARILERCGGRRGRGAPWHASRAATAPPAATRCVRRSSGPTTVSSRTSAW